MNDPNTTEILLRRARRLLTQFNTPDGDFDGADGTPEGLWDDVTAWLNETANHLDELQSPRNDKLFRKVGLK